VPFSALSILIALNVPNADSRDLMCEFCRD
jgi:hypothetical protein